MKTPERDEWIKALRSGDYEQSKHMLHSNRGWCCLGVACDIFKETLDLKVDKVLHEEGGFEVFYNYDSQVLPRAVQEHIGLNTPEGLFKSPRMEGANAGETLSSVNDEGATFEQIATILEDHEDLLFTDKKDWEKS